MLTSNCSLQKMPIIVPVREKLEEEGMQNLNYLKIKATVCVS